MATVKSEPIFPFIRRNCVTGLVIACLFANLAYNSFILHESYYGGRRSISFCRLDYYWFLPFHDCDDRVSAFLNLCLFTLLHLSTLFVFLLTFTLEGRITFS